MRHELVARHLLVELAERPGEAGARRRQRLEARRSEDARRPGVPGIRHHEQLLSLVQLPKAGPSLAGVHGSILGEFGGTVLVAGARWRL